VGSTEEVVAKCRQLRDAAAARQQRQERMRELLAEAQLPAHYLNGYLQRLCIWVERGEGSEQEALAAAQAKHAQEQAKEQAREQRRARMEALLADEQLPAHYVTAIPAVAEHVNSERGSEGAALEAARAAHLG
jgi:hypothetical protein